PCVLGGAPRRLTHRRTIFPSPRLIGNGGAGGWLIGNGGAGGSSTDAGGDQVRKCTTLNSWHSD
ncbi:hypothetical protein PJI23_34410, partial [Mycobacterium kansasii]